MKDIIFELCAESLEAARAAQNGGADRVELCAALSSGGLTPSVALTTAATAALSIPVYLLIRPRSGDFVYSPDEFMRMRREIEEAREVGAAGVVLGILHPDGRVDVERSRELVELAYPMKTTFHRAFDATPDLFQALEDVIWTGADCLLTSGGKPNVQAGADAIARLQEKASGRLHIMAGGGLTLENLADVVYRTGVSCLHGSLTNWRRNGSGAESAAGVNTASLEADLREAIRLFRHQLSMREFAV
jgi:copper homeostasis protein